MDHVLRAMNSIKSDVEKLVKMYAGGVTNNDFYSLMENRLDDVLRVANVIKANRDKKNKCEFIVKYCAKELNESMPLTLSDSEKLEMKKVWGKLWDKGIVRQEWPALYKRKNNIFDPNYIGHDLHNYYIEENKVDQNYIRGLCDRNYMCLILPMIKQPETILRKINGFYLDCNHNKVSEKVAAQIIFDKRHDGAVIKICRSSGGKGVTFVSDNSTYQEIFDLLRRDPNIIVQGIVKQHDMMAKMNKSSVNTIRIMTMILNGEAVVLSAVVRIGSPGKKVDNFHSGGVSCGINEDGTLNEVAHSVTGESLLQHSNGFYFKDGVIPNYDKVIEVVKKLNYCIPVFGIVSWDICIDELGEPVLLEFNIGGGLTLHQLNNGPLYGKYREAIIKEIFDKYSTKGATLDYSYSIYDDGVRITKGSSFVDLIFIPESIEDKKVVSIGDKCFYNCFRLKKVVLSKNIVRIRSQAFSHCSNLKEIYIPAEVNYIANDAFVGANKVIIHCEKNSYAEDYAIKHNIQFKVEL